MIDLSFDELVVLILFFVLLALLVLFMYQTIKKHRQAHILTLGLFSGVLGLAVMAFLPFFPIDSFMAKEGTIIAIGFFYTLTYYLIYFHYEQVSRLTPRLERLIITSMILGLGAFTTILLIMLPDDPSLLLQFNDLAQDSMRLIAMFFALTVTFSSWKLVNEKEALGEMLAVLILFIGGFPTLIANHTEFKNLFGVSFYLIGDVITFIGLVLLLMVFIINPDYLYRLPFPIYYIMLFNSSGLTFYSKTVENKRITSFKLSDQLVSATISAITMFLKEGIGTGESQLKLIDASDRSLIFSQSYNGSIIAMLMSSRITYFTKKSLTNLLVCIPKEIITKIDSSTILEYDDLVPTIDEVVHEVFPYLKF